MGRACNVPGCHSNYGNQKVYTSIFSFPKDPERRAKWIEAIHKDKASWSPGQYSGICIKHFAERYIIREDVATRNDGSILRVPRKHPALTKDACPTLFEKQTSYDSSLSPGVNLGERRARLEEGDELESKPFLPEDKIQSFYEFTELYCDKLKSELQAWTVICLDDSVHFVKYNPSTKKTDVVIVVNDDLKVGVFYEGKELPLSNYSFLGKEFQCDTWTKFKNLFNHFKLWSVITLTVED